MWQDLSYNQESFEEWWKLKPLEPFAGLHTPETVGKVLISSLSESWMVRYETTREACRHSNIGVRTVPGKQFSLHILRSLLIDSV